MDVGLLVRGRFVALPGAAARAIAGNAWEIRVPRSPEAERLLGRGLAKLDGAVLLIDGQQTEPALISGEGPEHVTASAWALP